MEFSILLGKLAGRSCYDRTLAGDRSREERREDATSFHLEFATEMEPIARRQFVVAGAAWASFAAVANADSIPSVKVGIVGHTGRGDYGHGLHTMWSGVAGAEVVAVADADPQGLAGVMKQLKGVDGFEDYRAMFEKCRPQVVAIGMRHIDQHRDVAIAAIEAGVRGIYLEKPFCRSLREADEMVAAAHAKNVKIAVAHRNRYHPVLPVVKRLVDGGAIGKILEYRMRGKEDARGGMLDLWVLGSHLVNLVHYFAGRPVACSAVVLIDGRLATRRDAALGAEGIGMMAGNEVHARFEMENGIVAYFDSIAKAGNSDAGFGVQMIGTEGMIDLRIDREPLAHLRHGSPFRPSDQPTAWIPISTQGVGEPETYPNIAQAVSKHWLPGQDLLHAIENDRMPLCHGGDAATTIEMISAVSVSHLQSGSRIEFPLAVRDNPWG